MDTTEIDEIVNSVIVEESPSRHANATANKRVKFNNVPEEDAEGDSSSSSSSSFSSSLSSEDLLTALFGPETSAPETDAKPVPKPKTPRAPRAPLDATKDAERKKRNRISAKRSRDRKKQQDEKMLDACNLLNEQYNAMNTKILIMNDMLKELAQNQTMMFDHLNKPVA